VGGVRFRRSEAVDVEDFVLFFSYLLELVREPWIGSVTRVQAATHSGDRSMKKFLFQNAIIFSTVFLTLFSVSASAQTVSLSDGTILQGNTNRVGLNIGSIDYWDNGQILNNLIGISNPGFEPLVDRQIWSLAVAGSTTSFQTPNIYDGVPANYWAGATFMVEESQNGGAELGCTGTIASNTGPNYPVTQTNYQYPVFTI